MIHVKHMTTISCVAPYGVGGLGKHLAELIEQHRAAGTLLRYYCARPRSGDEAISVGLTSQVVLPLIRRYTPVRFDAGLTQWTDFEWFDRAVARRYRSGADRHIGFSGQTLRTFASARLHAVRQFVLVSPTAHVAAVRRLHDLANATYPIERDWLHRRLVTKAVREYGLADSIQVGSEYVRQSFLAAGVPENKLERVSLQAAPRFQPRNCRSTDGVFRLVYTGALTVAKGVPLLLDAFVRANLGRAELTLVGQTGSRGMRAYVERRLAAEPRVRIRPGDPLPHLMAADVYVHPSYQDGFGYAVAEALAIGLPVIVTEDTGAKELVQPGGNGWIVPTGNVDALIAALEGARSRILSSAHGEGRGSGDVCQS